jgi:hypothetical protein
MLDRLRKLRNHGANAGSASGGGAATLGIARRLTEMAPPAIIPDHARPRIFMRASLPAPL